MTNKTMAKISMAIFLIVLIFSISAFAQTNDCSKTKDADIVASIKKQIKKQYGTQASNRYRISSKNHIVTLRGKFYNRKEARGIFKLASQTSCVKSVVPKFGCPIGYMQCPDGSCEKKCPR